MLCLVVQLCLTFCDSMDCSPSDSSVHGDSSGKNTGVGCCALLQGIFPTQGSNPGLLHCKWILYHLSHQESPYVFTHTHTHTHTQTHTHTCIYTHATIFKMEPAHMHKGRYWSSTKNSARRGPTLIPTVITLVIITAIISKESSVSQAL